MNATQNRKAETMAGACESRPVVRAGVALRIQIQLLLLAALLGAGSAITLRAQLVPDGATATFANVTTNINGTVTVGTNGSFTLLVLADNALVTNSLRGVIGQNVTARSNEVRIISPTARWEMNTLFVGSNGAFNRLVISNGAQVIGNSAGNSGIIGQTANSSNNLALVTGAGSVWSNAGALNFGSSGAGNQLVVSNGARVHAVQQTYVGLLISSTNNRVTVTGADSLWSSGGIILGLNGPGNRLSVLAGGGVLDDVGEIGGAGGFNVVDVTGSGSYWTNTGSFQVGSGSAGNQLTVSDGAVVTAGNYGSVGGSSSGASLNTATVADPGSRWLIDGDLYVGRDGPLNRLSVNNGGLVAATNLFVGFQPTATSNRVAVNGGTLRVTNAAGTGVLDVRRGTNQLVSGLVEADRLLLTNAAGRFEFLGGTLITRGATINNLSTMTVGAPGGGSAFWDVRPGPSNHFAVNSILIGNGSSSNQMLVSDGARLTNSFFGIVGLGAGGDGNSATVTGPGSRWDTASDMRVGESGGVSNRLTVDGGGLVVSSGGSVGFDITSIGNTATVTGSGSEWRLRNNLEVGSAGSFNQLVVSDGAVVQDTSGILAAFAQSSNNTAVVTGPGSLWSNRVDTIVGWFGPGNQLLVTNGGRVVTVSGGTIGSQASAPGNVATVTGNGSVWNSGIALSVGYAGAGNRLVVEAGGRVESNTGRIGYGGGSNNLALVTGAGSTWSNVSLEIGGFGANNQLIVSNGAVVADVDGFLGHDPGASNNVALVTGAGSLWHNSDGLLVGYRDSRNQLVVSNGATVVNNHGYLGYFNTADNNTVQVVGAGSVWSNRTDLSMGLAGEDNDLFVNTGGKVFVNGVMEIGTQAGADNNFVLVGGTGTSFTVSSNVYVGIEGEGNVMFVVAGASGSAGGETRIGLNTGGDFNYNELVVAGTGSGGARATWTSQGGFFIGGGHNYLRVENGGVVRGFGTAYVGTGGGPNNGVVVSGPGSLLEMTNDTVIVGFSDTDNQVEVRDGGKIRSQNATLGSSTLSSNSLVTVTGPGAVWEVAGSFTVGSSGPRNQLVVSNQGAVLAPFVTVGAFTSSTHNRVTVDGTLRATNILGTGQLDIRRGTNVLNAGVIETDRLVLTNTTQGFFEFNGGTLITRGLARPSTSQFMVEGSTAPATWDVRAGTGHALQSLLIVGFGSSSSRLLITNGGTLTNLSLQGVLGWDFSAKSNSATVSGPGSQWRLPTSDLYLGNAGSFSRLVVSNGGWVSDQNGYLGTISGSSNNVAVITEAGSVWSNRLDLNVGLDGSRNILAVNNGATVNVGRDGKIGVSGGASNNSMFVSHPGTSLTVASNFFVGSNGAFNVVQLATGASASIGGKTYVGSWTNGNNNTLDVSDAGSVWTSQGDFVLGGITIGSGAAVGRNLLLVRNGGVARGFDDAAVGLGGSLNEVIIRDPGSLWDLSSGTLFVGESGGGNQVTIRDGGEIRSAFGDLGPFTLGSNALVTVTGPGAKWQLTGGLVVGLNGPGQRVVIDSGGAIEALLGATVGQFSSSTHNRVTVDGGVLRATNASLTAVLDVRRGTNVLNAGLIEADILRMTNGAAGKLELNGGTLSLKESEVINGQVFRVGNGVTPATLILAGNGAGSHLFAPPASLSISTNGALTGNGSLAGALTVQPGGLLSPGLSIGTISLSQLGSPSLQGTVLMEISKNGSVLTNDALFVSLIGAFNYGGALMVTNVGPTALANGDRFQLFSATSYAGAFTTITLPPLNAGLVWTNMLLVDGSLEVVSTTPPGFSALSLSGTNLVFAGTNGPPNASFNLLASTNVALPLSNWVVVLTNQFDASGSFHFTNPIAPGRPERFFQINVP